MSHVGLVSLQQHGLGRNGDLFRDRADLESHVDAGDVIDDDFKPFAIYGTEALRGGLDVIDAGLDIEKRESTLHVAFGLADLACRLVGEDDLGFGYD